MSQKINWEREKKIHSHVKKYGFNLDVGAMNPLIYMCVKCGSVGNA